MSLSKRDIEQERREKRCEPRIPSNMQVEVITKERQAFKGRLRDISRGSLYIYGSAGWKGIKFTDNRELVELKMIYESSSISIKLHASVARCDSEGVALVFSTAI